jgi:2-polyprenyl-3-methyl-5-hydroxy-6-metoxy-1,4-benzoquinol methylase
MMTPHDSSTMTYAAEDRARQSRGTSSQGILDMVNRAMERRGLGGACVVDVGCGAGDLYPVVRPRFSQYVGVDVVRYDGFPGEARFCQLDLDSGNIPMADECADVVVAVEVIEHLENPRQFARQVVRLAKRGGWVIITTPNQLSLLSLLTLVLKKRFQAFQDVHYPTHITALLEVDLRRIAAECGLEQIEIEYSRQSRIPGMARHYPEVLSRRFPQALSDNVLLIGRRADRK